MAKKVDIKEGIKPIAGAPTNFGQGTTIRQLDDEGRIASVKTSGAPLDTYDVKTPQETNNPTRVGDYYFAPDKTLRVWENSPTDILQKYKIAVGGTEAPANTVSIANEGTGAVSGIATGTLAGSLGGLPGMAAGALVGGIAGALNAHNTAAEEALKKWQEENVKYDSAVEFYRDDNGSLKYKVDYQKMGTGGPRSGEAVKEAQERETKVELGDDGRLKVTVSPIFASTARFKELMDFISENYGGLTKKTENYEGIIKEIKDGIDGEAKSFVTNMRLYADYANSFPNATPESIVSAYMTEAAGYVDPTKMSDFQMTIINENGEKETKTAEEFFNSVYNMNNDDKNRLLERLNTIVYGENSKADDNIKAIASGELKALYAVSRNPEEYKENKYQNMLNADFFVTLVSNFAPLGLNAGDVLNFVSGGNWVQTKQEFLNQDEMAQFIGSSAGVAAGFGLWKGGTALVEKGLKMLPGTSQLFNASLEGKSGGALANILKASESLGVGGSKASTSVATAATASAAFKTLKVGVFDAALAGTKTLVSDADFWSEFGQDFARDAILEAVFSYYDMIQFEKTVDDSVVWMYKDKSGNAKILPTYQERVFVSEDGLDTSTAVEYRPVGAMNIQKTRAGEDVGVIKSNLGTTYYYNGNSITVTPNGEVQKLLTGPNVTTDGMPVLKTGIVEVSGGSSVPKTEISEVKKALEKNGLPTNTEVFKASATSASAAQVAAKIAKVDSSKAGLKINTELFNKNAALDTINEIALSKTADLTAWQNRSQKFVSISDNANQEKNLIANGEYIESSAKAFEDYNKTLAELNITKRYSKIDANYLKAKVQLQRAAYLDRHKVEGDTRDYTAEALTKYGEAITRVPEDRAIALDNFLTKRIARHDATKLAAKKSGKIDVKKLDSYMESDLQKEIGWVPQWKKQETYNGILDKFYGISQERNIYKTWLPEGGWVDLDKLEDPIKADDRFLNFVATNMGINDMKESTSMALDDARMLVDNTPSSATVRKEKLDSIKNKDELTKKFSDIVAEKKKEIKEKVPNQKQYKELMQKNIEESGVLEAIEDAIAGDTTMRAVIGASEVLLNKLNEYNKLFSYDFDVESYMNTEYLPNLKEALNAKNMGLAATIVNQTTSDVAPYRSQSSLLKSAQESVAEEWREWAEKHIKAGRASNKELKKFAEDNDLKLPNDKRPLPNKIKHALWELLESGKKLPRIEGLNMGEVSKGVSREDFYQMLDGTPLFQSATKDKKELVDLVAAEINGTSTDAYEMGTAATAVGMNGRYPITWYKNGRPYTRFITYRNAEEQRLAEAVTELFTDKQLIKQPGVISRVASALANDFRLLTTGWDPTRISANLSRDIGRGQVTSGGQSFIEPGKIFNSLLEFGNYSTAEKQKLSKALDNVSKMIAGETYNAAYRNNKKAITQITKQYLSENGANPLRRFTYSLLHDPTSILEAPADFFEDITRKRLAKSAAVVKLRQLQKDGATVDEQIKGMTDAAFFAGREYTANFQRKGRVIAQTSKYVAYQSSAYAGLNSLKLAFINNPEAVTKNFAVFLILYLILLSDTLGDEDSRKNYYRLSDYDRGNSIIISLDDNTVLTLPLDQEIAGFLFPYRRFLETLNGVDPVSFFEFVWGTLTEPLPMDLSGFSEGEGFNLKRGVEKLASQNMPNVLSGIQEAATGYDLYYGTDLEVTKEDLKNYGIYAPEPGDYTTTGKNSATLRQVANATGIPQWQLQIMVSNYGGNVGSYLLNILDKMQGATRDAQGGKDFADSIFRSFVATDQDAAKNAFYDGIEQLQEEKGKLVQKIVSYNEDIKTASGEAKVDLQLKLQKAKDEFAIKVADFVDKYVSAYEITGGLPKSQAMQIYYLFRLDDDYTVYEEGSPEQYYKTQAEQKFKNQATAMSAPILDKYYNNRIGNIYQDADGNWRQYLSAGVQAMRNSIYGQGEKHMVNLLNILEGKDSNMVSLRRQVKEARSKAFEKRDFTTRDKIGYEFDKKVINAISPYIERYGAKNVLGNSDVLDYLSDWFFVPDKFKRTKRGRYVSLAHNAQTEEAFVRPYIKYVFGLPTNYYSYSDTSLTSPSLGDLRR